MLTEGQNPMEVITQLEKMRASITVSMPSQATPGEALNARRIVDAASADPACKIEKSGMGGDGTVSREEILSNIATQYSNTLERRLRGRLSGRK